MRLYYFAHVYNLFFLKPCNPTSHADGKSDKSKTEQDLPPELLKLKKDLW